MFPLPVAAPSFRAELGNRLRRPQPAHSWPPTAVSPVAASTVGSDHVEIDLWLLCPEDAQCRPQTPVKTGLVDGAASAGHVRGTA